MTRPTRWPDPFVVDLSPSPIVLRVAWIAWTCSAGITLIAIGLRTRIALPDAASICVSILAMLALGVGAVGIRRHASFKHRLEVDAQARCRLDGIPCALAPASRAHGQFVYLVVRSDGTDTESSAPREAMQTMTLARMLGPGSMDAEALRRLATWVQWRG